MYDYKEIQCQCQYSDNVDIFIVISKKQKYRVKEKISDFGTIKK